MEAELPLFRRFPDLKGRLPHHPLLGGPTPVRPLPLEGVSDLFVKQDERSSPVYGGNKPRKLEFLLGHARARRARRIVTSGGLGTNHGLATLLLGREVGLSCSLLLLDQPVTEDVRTKLRLFHAAGAKLCYGGSVAGAVGVGVAELARSTLAGERPHLVPPGGSSARGNLGFVSAGLELAEQVRAGELPEPVRLFVAVGTGGTLVGLALGLRLAQLSTRLVGVLVTDLLAPSPRRLVRIAAGTSRFLRRHAPEAPRPLLGAGAFDFVTDQVGAGYGVATPEAEDAVAAAAEHGLALDTTYTGKALAGLLAAARRGGLDGPTLFWNTYNAVDVVERFAPLPDPSELPASMRRFFGGA